MAMWTRLLDLLNELPSQGSGSPLTYSVKPLPVPRLGWIGKNDNARAAFLLLVPQDLPRPHAISLPHLSVRHHIRVTVNFNGTASEAVVSLLECVDADPAITEVFIRCVSSIIEDSEPSDNGGLNISGLLDKLVELFRDASFASEGEILGLWGELLLITMSINSSELASYWRKKRTSTYDFDCGNERLDVKVTTGPYRQHHLSYNQAKSRDGVIVAFASMLTEQNSSGTSIRDLWQRVVQAAPEMQHHIDHSCVRTLGKDWHIAQDRKYDIQKAINSLAIFNAEMIPRFIDLPQGVLQARFISDFEQGSPWSGPPPSTNGLIALALSCQP